MNCNIKKSFIVGVTLIFIGFSSFLFAQSQVVMIGDSIAAYYPESFDASQTLPSLALLNEPKELGAAPDSWNEKVSFYSADKKNIAKIYSNSEIKLDKENPTRWLLLNCNEFEIARIKDIK